MPDHIESTRYVEGDGSDFMPGIEDLHPLLGEQKQHVQGGVTGSDSILGWSEMRPLEKRKDFMLTGIMDPINLFMIGRKQISLQLRGSVFASCLWNTFTKGKLEGR